jgi:hypothetical protein
MKDYVDQVCEGCAANGVAIATARISVPGGYRDGAVVAPLNFEPDEFCGIWFVQFGLAANGKFVVRRLDLGQARFRFTGADDVRLMPDVILTATTINLTVIRQATSTVPVVFVLVADPVAQGFVASVRQPGGNVTGFSLFEFSLGSKWLDLLKRVAPGLARAFCTPEAAIACFTLPGPHLANLGIPAAQPCQPWE